MLQALMAPANFICDRLDMDDENERGLFRVFVNTLVGISIGAVGWFAAWMLLGL
jgi:hypothetical protein